MGDKHLRALLAKFRYALGSSENSPFNSPFNSPYNTI